MKKLGPLVLLLTGSAQEPEGYGVSGIVVYRTRGPPEAPRQEAPGKARRVVAEVESAPLEARTPLVDPFHFQVPSGQDVLHSETTRAVTHDENRLSRKIEESEFRERYDLIVEKTPLFVDQGVTDVLPRVESGYRHPSIIARTARSWREGALRLRVNRGFHPTERRRAGRN